MELTKSELNLLIKTALPTIKRRIKLAKTRLNYLKNPPVDATPINAPNTEILIKEMEIKDLTELKNKVCEILENTPIKLG